MKNILILTSGYCGKATANGLCAQSLVRELEDNSVLAYVISVDSNLIAETDSDRVKSIHIPKATADVKKRNRLYYIFRLLKNILLYSKKVKYNKDMVNRIVEEAEKICSKVSVDAVVCMYFPLEAVIAGSALKRNFGDLKFIIYELDSVVDGIAGYGKYNTYMLKSSVRAMKKLYDCCDLAMILECHKSYWHEEFRRHDRKMQLIDLPLMVPSNISRKSLEANSLVQLVYAGTLDNNYRSPDKLIETFKHIGCFEWIIDFFSKGCENKLESFKNENRNVRCNGYVAQEILDMKIRESDILLSIGNKFSNSLPSKIISYMTYGKPIVHFCMQENDVCEQYLNRYPLSLIIPKDESAETAARRITEFVEKCQGAHVRFEELTSIFPKNLPSYSMNIIMDCINNKENGYCEEKR